MHGTRIVPCGIVLRDGTRNGSVAQSHYEMTYSGEMSAVLVL